MATHDGLSEAEKRAQQEEEKFQVELKKYLDKNPFPEGDYQKQKSAYEKLVEKVLRLEENNNVCYDVRL